MWALSLLILALCATWLLFVILQCDQDGCTTAVSDAEIAASVAVAKTVDTVIVNVAVTSTEGFDRFNLSLGHQQDALVSEVAEANPNTVCNF